MTNSLNRVPQKSKSYKRSTFPGAFSLEILRQGRCHGTSQYKRQVWRALVLSLPVRAEKAASKKRRTYLPLSMRPKATFTMSTVLNNVTLLTPEEVQDSLETVELAVKEAHKGALTYPSFVMLETATSVAAELEKESGVRGLQEFFDGARQALDSIHARCNASGVWVPSALKGPELTALKDFQAAHQFQLSNCTRKEISDAASRLKNQITQGKLKDESKSFELVETLHTMRNDLHDVKVHVPVLREVK